MKLLPLLSDGNPQVGLWAYEQDLSLELVAEYVIFNWQKNTILVQVIGKLFGKKEPILGEMTSEDLALMDYYQRSLRKW